MPYYDGSRSLSDDLKACVDARKAADDHARKAEHNRRLEVQYNHLCPRNAWVYADRAAMFKHQKVALTVAADDCSKRAYDALMTGDYYDGDEWDINRTV